MDTVEPIEQVEEPIRDEGEEAVHGRQAERRPRASQAELTADEAERKLRAGEPIVGARVVGRLRLRGTFEKPIRLQDVEVSNLVIDGASFAGPVAFIACRLHRPVIQRKAEFAAGLSFRSCELSKPKFDGVTIRDAANFQSSRFRGKADFLRVHFAGPSNLWEASFDGWVDFKSCRFDAAADLRSICVEEGFSFRKCHVGAAFLFRGATVAKKCDFHETRFDGPIDLSKAKLHDFAYLETIELGEAARFCVWNAVAERIQVRPDQIEGRLASEIDGDHARAMCEYGLLKRNFEALHRHEEEDWAFYRFKVNERRSRPRSWRRPWSKLSQGFEWLVLDLGCRYGTSPFRTVAAAGAMILAFSLVYMIGVDLLPLGEGPVPFPGQDSTSLANRVVIGLVTSVSAFTDGLGSLRETAQGWMNLFLVAESLLGTLIWGLFIVAFSRKVIR